MSLWDMVRGWLGARREPLAFPPPYQGMVAINSDVEFTSWAAQLDLLDIFAAHDLESSFSFWCFGDEAVTWRLFDDADQPASYATAAAFLATSGLIDTLHSYGGITDGAGCSFDRSRMKRALGWLADNGVYPRVYTNHGSPQDIQNVGGDWGSYQQGDVPGSSAYHLDMTTAHGVRFFWCDIDYDNEFPYFEASAGKPRSLFCPQISRDGTAILRFRRFRGAFPNAPTATTLGPQLQLVLPHTPSGYSIVYQHLGASRSPDGKAHPNVSPYLPEDALTSLRALADLQTRGQIIVTTTERLLMHALLMATQQWTFSVENRKTIVTFPDTITLGACTVSLQRKDLSGFVFPVGPRETLLFRFAGETWQPDVFTHQNRRFTGTAWQKLPILDIMREARRLSDESTTRLST